MTGRVLGRCGFSSDSWSRGGCPDLRTSERQPRLTTRGAPGNRHPTPGVLEPPSVGEVAGGRAGGAAFLLFLASWSGDGLVLREDPPRSQLPLQEGERSSLEEMGTNTEGVSAPTIQHSVRSPGVSA